MTELRDLKDWTTHDVQPISDVSVQIRQVWRGKELGPVHNGET